MPPAGRGRGRGQAKSPGRGRTTRTRKAVAESANVPQAMEDEIVPQELEATIEDAVQQENEEDTKTEDVPDIEAEGQLNEGLEEQSNTVLEDKGEEELIDEDIATAEDDAGEQETEAPVEEDMDVLGRQSEELGEDPGDEELLQDEEMAAEEQHGDEMEESPVNAEDCTQSGEGDISMEQTEESTIEENGPDEYCVVDEVTEEKEVQEVGEQDPDEQKTDETAAKTAEGGDADNVDEQNQKKGDTRETKTGPRTRPLRGFLPTKQLIAREVKGVEESCRLLASPMTREQLLSTQIDTVLQTAKQATVRWIRPDSGPGEALLDAKFSSQEDVESATSILKELTDVQVRRSDPGKIKASLEKWNKKTNETEFPAETTLVVFNLPKEIEVSELQSIFGECQKLMIPKNESGVNKCFGFVRMKDKESVDQWVEKKTVTYKDAVLNLMPIATTPKIQMLMSKLRKLQLKHRGPLASGLKTYYEELSESILYFLNWATPTELQGTDRKILNKFHSQIFSRIKFSERQEKDAATANKGQPKKGKNQEGKVGEKADGKSPASKDQGGGKNQRQAARRRNRAMHNKNQGPNKGNKSPGMGKQGPPQNYGDRPSGPNAGERRRRGQKPMKRPPYSRYDDMSYDAKRPRRDSGGYNRRSFSKDRRDSNDRRHSTGGMGMGMQSINDITGLPNMNRMQTMGMLPMMNGQPMMGMNQGMGASPAMQGMAGPQDMGPGFPDHHPLAENMGSYGGQMGRDDARYRGPDGPLDRRGGYPRNAGNSMGPRKTESAINLLLGLSKMLKGQSSARDVPQDYDYHPGGGY